MKNLSAILLKFFESAAHVAAVVALVLVFLQMRTEDASRKTAASLEFVNQYNSDALIAQRHNATKPWVPFRAQLDAINNGEGLTDREADLLVTRVIDDYDRAHPEEPATLSILEIAAFYDRLEICVERRICDPQVAVSYFRDDAREFLEANRVLILRLRTSIAPNAGKGLEKFATRGAAA